MGCTVKCPKMIIKTKKKKKFLDIEFFLSRMAFDRWPESSVASKSKKYANIWN